MNAIKNDSVQKYQDPTESILKVDFSSKAEEIQEELKISDGIELSKDFIN